MLVNYMPYGCISSLLIMAAPPAAPAQIPSTLLWRPWCCPCGLIACGRPPTFQSLMRRPTSCCQHTRERRNQSQFWCFRFFTVGFVLLLCVARKKKSLKKTSLFACLSLLLVVLAHVAILKCRKNGCTGWGFRQIVSGWNGKDTTEVVYPDIVDMVYVWRFFGR